MTGRSKHSFESSQVSAFRLARHYLADGQQASDLIAVSEGACGIQAQVMSAAEMALWSRLHTVKRSDIHSALWDSRTLVKTSCMRGTLHLVSAADFPIYISALKRSRVQALRSIAARRGVTEKDVASTNEAIVEALSEGPLTQRELNASIAPGLSVKAREWNEFSAWGFARAAVVEGLICYGPDRGQESTFVRVDQWLPAQRTVSEHEAKGILLAAI